MYDAAYPVHLLNPPLFDWLKFLQNRVLPILPTQLITSRVHDKSYKHFALCIYLVAQHRIFTQAVRVWIALSAVSTERDLLRSPCKYKIGTPQKILCLPQTTHTFQLNYTQHHEDLVRSKPRTFDSRTSDSFGFSTRKPINPIWTLLTKSPLSGRLVPLRRTYSATSLGSRTYGPTPSSSLTTFTTC